MFSSNYLTMKNEEIFCSRAFNSFLYFQPFYFSFLCSSFFSIIISLIILPCIKYSTNIYFHLHIMYYSNICFFKIKNNSPCFSSINVDNHISACLSFQCRLYDILEKIKHGDPNVSFLPNELYLASKPSLYVNSITLLKAYWLCSLYGYLDTLSLEIQKNTMKSDRSKLNIHYISSIISPLYNGVSYYPMPFLGSTYNILSTG